MDIRPGRKVPTESGRLQTPVVTTDRTKTLLDDVAPAYHPSAQAVHSRVKPSHGGVIDLRAQPHSVETTSMHNHTVERHAVPQTAKPVTRRAAIIPAERLERAKNTPKSDHITRFTAKRVKPTPVEAKPAEVPAPYTPVPPHVVTQHQSLSEILAKTPVEPVNALRTSSAGRIAATVAAVAILAGYVWVQNYPKLAITSAGNHAGIAASLPGYLPSSYSLATTTTAPGIVTLKFASPTAQDPLTITQHRTDWDTSSLLDNYVSKVAADYSSIEGQGLTVYLFDSNNASWVNHGVWYSIAGTARLSREQILKIAYSL